MLVNLWDFTPEARNEYDAAGAIGDEETCNRIILEQTGQAVSSRPGINAIVINFDECPDGPQEGTS